MKIRYEKPTPEHPQVKYYLTAQNNEEMRFLTILRDLISGKSAARLRFIGADPVGYAVPSLPDNPVQTIAVAVEGLDEQVEEDDPLDPQKPSPSKISLSQRKAKIAAIKAVRSGKSNRIVDVG